MLLDPWIDIGKGADRPRQGTRRHFRPRRHHPRPRPVHFRVSLGHFQTERHRFGVDAMAAADADTVFMFKRPAFQRGQQAIQIGDQQIGSAHQLQVETGIQHIGRGHALMDEPRRIGADDLSQMGQKGDDIMPGHRFNLINPVKVKLCVAGLPHRLGIGARDHAQIGHGVAGMGLYLEPDPEPGFG